MQNTRNANSDSSQQFGWTLLLDVLPNHGLAPVANACRPSGTQTENTLRLLLHTGWPPQSRPHNPPRNGHRFLLHWRTIKDAIERFNCKLTPVTEGFK